MDEALAGSQWQYRMECQIAPDGALTVTAPDPALLALLAQPLPDLARPEAWVGTVPPQDVARSLEAIRTLGLGQIWEGRVRVHGAGGRVIILHMHATPSRLPDGLVSVAVKARDVTEVARLETQLAERDSRIRLLEEGVRVAFWTTDDALRYTWSSGTALQDLGLEEDALVGGSLYEFFETEDPEAVPIAAHQRALAGEAATYDINWEGRDWRALPEPLRDELGGVRGVLGVGIDLTSLLDSARARRPGEVVRAASVRNLDGFPSAEVITIHNLVIDPERFEVFKDGAKLRLTVSEFKLLMEFSLRPGRVLSREVLVERVWGHRFVGSSASVAMAVKRLRDKIEDDPQHATLIETVRGVGYRFRGDDR